MDDVTEIFIFDCGGEMHAENSLSELLNPNTRRHGMAAGLVDKVGVTVRFTVESPMSGELTLTTKSYVATAPGWSRIS